MAERPLDPAPDPTSRAPTAGTATSRRTTTSTCRPTSGRHVHEAAVDDRPGRAPPPRRSTSPSSARRSTTPSPIGRAPASGRAPSARRSTPSGSIHSLQLDVEPFEVLTSSTPATPTSSRPGSSGPTRSSTARSSRSPRPARSRSSSAATTRSPGRARPRSPRSAGRAASASSISTPTPTPPPTTGACSPATARRCAGSSSRARSRARTSSRSACAATGRRSRRSRWMQEQGLRWHFMREIEERGAEAVIAEAIDEALDGPDSSTSASTSTSSIRAWRPGPARPSRAGCSPARCCARSARSSAPSTSPAMDIVEVSPPYDQAETTAMAANRAALEAISALAVAASAGPAGRRALATAGRQHPADGRRADRRRSPTPTRAAALARLYDLDLADDPGDLDLYLALADRADGPDPRARRRAPAGWPIPLAEAGHGSPASTSTRPCSPGPGGAPASGRGRGSPDARRGRPRRPAAARRRHASASRSSPSTRCSSCRPAPPSGRRSGRSPTTSPRAASRSSTSGCPTPRTSPASTAGSSSSGRASTRRPARSSPRPARRSTTPRPRRSTLTDDLRGGRPGRPVRRWVRRDRLRLVRRTSCAGSPRTPGCASRCWPAATTSGRSGPAASGPSSSPSRPERMLGDHVGPGPPGTVAIARPRGIVGPMSASPIRRACSSSRTCRRSRSTSAAC